MLSPTKRFFLFALCAMVLFSPAAHSKALWAKDSILIQTDHALSAPEKLSLSSNPLALRSLRPSGKSNVYSLKLSKGESVPDKVAALKGRPGIVCVEPNYIYRLAETIPNDPKFQAEQWPLKNTGQKGGFADEDIDATDAWDHQTGAQNVTVAVIDTGLDLDHPDIADNIWFNPGEIPGNDDDDDGNGYVDDWRGWNFFLNNNVPEDLHSHGTHVSGTIGALGNNGVGVAGVCWSIQVMPLACFDPATGEATTDTLVEAVFYAADNVARVINASWGDFIYSEILKNAIKSVGDSQALFVAAAGNDSLKNIDVMTFYPAGYDLDNVISVAASTVDAKIASFSNQGVYNVDLFAPGANIYNLIPNGNYGYKSGTSMATPHVSGAAALLLSQTPLMPLSELKGRILGGVDKKNDYLDRVATGGRLNVQNMFEADTFPPAPVTDLSPIWIGADGVTFQFTLTGDDGVGGAASGFELRYSKGTLDNSTWADASKAECPPSAGEPGTLKKATVHGLEPSTAYHFAVKIYDNIGNYSGFSNILTVRTASVNTLWFDDAEQQGDFWVPSADGRWQRTTVDAHSGSYSWTESPSGDYQSNVQTYLTSIPFSLVEIKNAWLSFHHYYDFEDISTNFNDGGEVQFSTDGGSAWTTMAYYYDGATPWREARIPLGELDGRDNVRLRFAFHSNNGTTTSNGWFIDDIRIGIPERLSWPEDVIVESRTPFLDMAIRPDIYHDNNAGGDWSESVAKAWRFGLATNRARTKSTDTTLGSSATFVPYFPVNGSYELFAIWGTSANASNARYRIHSPEGINDVYLNQDAWQNSDRWISLGTYYFHAGRNESKGSVTLDDSTVNGKPSTSTPGRIFADSIRCVCVQPMENTSPAFVMLR